MSEQPECPKRVARPPIGLVPIKNAGGIGRDAVPATKSREFFRRNIIANQWVLEIGPPIDMHRARNMPRVIKQNIFIRLYDPDALIVQMFFQPIDLHERFGMRVFGWMHSHKETSAGLRTEQGVLVVTKADSGEHRLPACRSRQCNRSFACAKYVAGRAAGNHRLAAW